MTNQLICMSLCLISFNMFAMDAVSQEHRMVDRQQIQLMHRKGVSYADVPVRIDMNAEEVRPSCKTRCCVETARTCCCLITTFTYVASCFCFKVAMKVIKEEYFS